MSRAARSLVLALTALLPAAAGAQTYATEWLTASPVTANRVNIAILGDGYTADAASQAKLTADATALLQRLVGQSPWSEVTPALTAKLVHVVSAESGATNGALGGTRNTALGAYFGCNGIDRLICLNATRAFQIAAQHFPEYSYVWVVVNDPKYGGSGGSLSVASTHSSSAAVLVHEFAHSAAHLADEYTTPYPGYGACDPQRDCPEPNATLWPDHSRVKWGAWVEPGTTLPTLSGTWSGVGLFEGARYLTTGVYRPKDSGCMMKALGSAYCSVCSEAIVSAVLGRLDLVDAASPATASVTLTNCGPSAFSVTPLPVAGKGQLSYRWTVDGVPQPDGGPSFTLPAGAAAGAHRIAVDVRYSSPYVRSDPANALLSTVAWSATIGSCWELTLTPAQGQVQPGGRLQFAAVGGSGGGHVFELATNASGGTIDAAGLYTAGPRSGAVDLVRVTDSAGNHASATVAVTAPLLVTPASVVVAAGGAQPFAASGGTGAGYTWRFATNRSGGSIDPAGRYVAGPKGNVTDVVRVTDSAGNVASASVSVTGGSRRKR